VNDPKFKHRAGWSSVCVTLFQILVNLVRMVYKSVKQKIASFKKARVIRAELKRSKKNSTL